MKMALEELQMIEQQIGQLDQQMASLLQQHQDAVHYATGCEGRVEIESEWTARKRERAAGRLCPAVELPHSNQKQA